MWTQYEGGPSHSSSLKDDLPLDGGGGFHNGEL